MDNKDGIMERVFSGDDDNELEKQQRQIGIHSVVSISFASYFASRQF